MHHRWNSELRALLAASALFIAAACSAGGPSSSLPSASAVGASVASAAIGSHGKVPVRRDTTGTVTATATFQASPSGGPIYAGRPILMEIAFNANPAPQDWENFTYTLPSLSTGKLVFAGVPPVSNTCTGVTFAPINNGDTMVRTISAPGAQITGFCEFSFVVFATAPGLYEDTAADATWNPNINNPQTETFQWNTQHYISAAVPPDHLYVPVIQTANQGVVQVYNQNAIGNPLCQIQDPTIPNPIAVTVNPEIGYIYVLDQSGTVAVFKPVSGTTCPGSPITHWSAPSSSTSLAIDVQNHVVVASCTNLTWYDGQGNLLNQSAAPTGSCFQDVAANYWDSGLYVSDSGQDAVYSVSPSNYGFFCGSNASFISGWGANPGYDGLFAPWHISGGPSSGTFFSSFAYNNSPTKWLPAGDIATASPCSQAVSNFMNVSPGYIESLAYDHASQVLVYSNGYNNKFGAKPPLIYSAFVVEYNEASGQTLSSPTYSFGKILLPGIGVGP